MIKRKEFLQFENLEVWKKARELVSFIYASTRLIQDRSFKDQLQRAGLSIMNNLAEGHEAGSAKANIRYLKIAKASSGEVRSMFYAASDLKFMNSTRSADGIGRATEISKMISGYIKSLQ